MFFIQTNKRTAVRKTLREAFDLVRKDMPRVHPDALKKMSRLLEKWPRENADLFDMMVPLWFQHVEHPMVCTVTWVSDDGC